MPTPNGWMMSKWFLLKNLSPGLQHTKIVCLVDPPHIYNGIVAVYPQGKEGDGDKVVPIAVTKQQIWKTQRSITSFNC